MYQFSENPSEGRKNLKFGYSSSLRGGRLLHEGKIRMTVENGLFLGNYLEGRLPIWLVSKATLPYKGVDHTTFCISTFNHDELQTFIKAVQTTEIWALRQLADRKEQEYKDRWEPQPFAWESPTPIKWDDDDNLPF